MVAPEGNLYHGTKNWDLKGINHLGLVISAVHLNLSTPNFFSYLIR